ncbi:MAG: alpha/beta fold hydrolase [Phycisphaerales bacterium]
MDPSLTPSPSIVLLPGLGANARLFGPQLDAFADRGAFVPAWPDPIDPSRGVEGVADSLEGELQGGGRLHRDAVLVGFSFGSQVALSMARRMLERDEAPPRAIVLVSGLRRTSQLTTRFRLQVAASTLLPDAAIGWAAAELIAQPFARACGLDHEQTLELQRMAAELDVAQFRRLARVACRWRFEDTDERRLREVGVRILHLHSERDPVIPPPPATIDGVERLAERAHLLTWTHAVLVNRLIERALAGESEARSGRV